MKKIAILTSGHFSKDDRLYYKFARTLQRYGSEVLIVSSLEALNENNSGIVINSFDSSRSARNLKSHNFLQRLQLHCPEIIICAEPFTVLPASIYKKRYGRSVKIIMDVTEWYPENITMKLSGIKKVLSYLTLSILNMLAVYRIDALIVGEKQKAVRYQGYRPGIRTEIFGYEGILNVESPVSLKKTRELLVLYSGYFTAERGFFRYLDVIKYLKANCITNIHFGAVGKFLSEAEKQDYIEFTQENPIVDLKTLDWKNYDDYLLALRSADLFIDLRTNEGFFDKSLPIKIFDYIGAGKPFIISDLSSIRLEPDLMSAGVSVNPHDTVSVARAIQRFVKDINYYKKSALNIEKLSKEKFNWKLYEQKFIHFIENC